VFSDYRLNPLLQKGCQQDIPKFCGDILKLEQNDAELEGKVIDCLKKQFANKVVLVVSFFSHKKIWLERRD
jgi:hypothetical protein